jgi:AAA15 family ATPase/GTPase
MIEKLVIKNFKSIKELEIDCRRINLFIGEPNTGKSNILEALGLLSWIGHNPHKNRLNNYLRFEGTGDLFFDSLLDEKIMIVFADKEVKCLTDMTFKNDIFIIKSKLEDKEVYHLHLDHSGDIKSGKTVELDEFSLVKYYSFLKQSNFPDTFFSYLLPPNGSNLFALIMSNKRIREIVNTLVKDMNLNFMLKPKEKKIEIVKQRDDLIISYPYISTSDTLQRVIFFSAAMESNEKSTLIFEEPESFAFPYYTKYLGERIAFDESNQYFISTHNPYLLLAILEKTPKDSVNVFVTYLKNYETKAKALTEEEISVLMDSDPFFNLKKFIDEE